MENIKIEKQSDSEILKIADPIWDEIAEGCRNKDWSRYSQFFTNDDRENPKHKKDILKAKDEVKTSALSDEKRAKEYMDSQPKYDEQGNVIS